MSLSIAFVGAGPTTLYTLNALVKGGPTLRLITIFEQQSSGGLGAPYSPRWTDPEMLSNIASVEIPPLTETLVAWLERQPEGRLRDLGVDPAGINDHAFYPRLAVGQYLQDQFNRLLDEARKKGFNVDFRPDHRVLDIRFADGRFCIHLATDHTPFSDQAFDLVVIATGHQWPEDPEAAPGYFNTPWPPSALSRISTSNIGVLGSALTAIDAVVALAIDHGTFREDGDGVLTYVAWPNPKPFHITLMSRKGLLPEADFYHPIPYEPLEIFSVKAARRLIDNSEGGLLQKTFNLFKDQLAKSDPDYADRVGLSEATLNDFEHRFFAERSLIDPFAWAASNLEEAARNYRDQVTVGWRYAILRMHEVIALIVPYFDKQDLHRFNHCFKAVFVDDYATVPHLSIKRLLALNGSGHLDILALGDEYSINVQAPDTGVDVIVNGERLRFAAFVDATGQQPLGIEDFPFQTLRRQGLVCDATNATRGGAKGVAIDEAFHPLSDNSAAQQIFCVSIPFILGSRPFVQGLTSSYEMGSRVARALQQLDAKGQANKRNEALDRRNASLPPR